MALIHDRCICLRRIEYSETSQILWLLARETGLVHVIAKGAHRKTKAGAGKFDGGVDLFDIGQALFIHDSARELGTLTEWHLLEGHLPLRRSLRAIHLGLYAAELSGLLIEQHDPHPELFDRLEQTLGDLATSRIEEAFLAFEMDLLRQTGYLPEINHCASCGGGLQSAGAAWFSSSAGGMLCSVCQSAAPDRMRLDARLLGLIRMMARLPRESGRIQRLPRLTRHQTDPVNRLLSRHMEQVLSRRLRLAPYILDRAPAPIPPAAITSSPA